MKYIVSAGVIDIDEVQPADNPNETKNETLEVAPK